jgi:hypothetical protein
MALLSQTPDQTAKDSLIKDLKRQLLLRAAADLNCEKIFTGECATSLAITLLSGKKIANLISFLKVHVRIIHLFLVIRLRLRLILFYFNHHYWGEVEVF